MFTVILTVSWFCANAQTTFTSTQTGNWNDGGTWGNTSPGVQGTDWPANTDHAIIATGTSVKLAAATTIVNLTINDGGVFDYDGNTLTLNGTVTPSFISDESGKWSDATTWLGSPGTPANTDKVIIARDHIVKLTGPTTIATLIINSGGTLDDDNRGDLTVTTKLLLDGERYGKKKSILNNGAELDGSGNHYSSKDLEIAASASVTILSGTDILVSKNFTLKGGSTVTNNGNITADNIKDHDVNDTWINAAGSSLTSLKDIMVKGTLTATATGNTVIYARQGDSKIKVPTSSTYNNLVVAGSLKKIMTGNLTITGDLTISSNLDTDAGNNYSLDIKGNWTSTGIYIANSAVVTFSGTGTQSITNTASETFYNLTVNKSSGTLPINDDVTVTNTLTMTSGNISTESNVLTLGDTITNEGTLSHTSGSIIGLFERWIAATTTSKLLFPVGSSSLYVPVEPTFSDGGKTSGTVIASFVETNPGNSGLSLDDGGTTVYNTFVEGYWNLTSANSFDPGTGFDLDLTGTGMTSFTVEAATRILKRTNSQSDWVAEGSHSAAVGDIAKRTGLTALSAQYALADDTNCTPPITYAITGDTEVCTDDTGDTYDVILNSGNTYYWSVTGGTINGSSSGVDVNSISVDWGSTGQVGNVNVYEVNTCTRSDDVDLPVNINTLPTSTISGSINVAEDQTGVIFSVESNAGYTYTWTIDGGVQTSGGTTNIITVDWGEAGIGSVSVIASSSSCGTDAAIVSLDVDIYSNILSVQSGDWNDPDTWDCNCNPINFQSVNILNGHRVTLTADETIQNITIDAGGVADQNNRKLKIEGNLILNGTITGNTINKPIEFKGGAGTTIDGSGSINCSGMTVLKVKGEATIVSTANLLIIGNVVVDNKKIITNYGRVTFKNNIKGKGTGAIWLNEANSYLKVGGEIFSTAGILKTSSTGNTVEYATTDALGATITTPHNATYYNLILSGSIDKKTEDDLTILGDLTINSGDFDISTNTNDLTLEGNWINTGTFTEGNQTVTFTGINNQAITNSNDETFYNLVVNKSSGNLTLNNDVTVSNMLTMTVGNIYTESNKITLGTSAANEGTLTYKDGTVIGQFERWIDNLTITKLLFPVGSAEKYRPAEPTFTDNTKEDGTVIAQFVETNPGSSGLSLVDGAQTIYNTFIEGYWDLTAANSFTTGSSYDLELTGSGFTSFNISATTRLLTRSESSSDWTANGTHVSAVDPKAKRTGLTTFSAQYAFGDNTNCTPPAAPTFSGNKNVCKGKMGGTYTITSSTVGLIDYTWSVTGGSIAKGQNTGTVKINWENRAQVGSVGLTVTNSSTISEETVVEVNVHTIPPATIFGDLLVPENETGVIYSVEQTTDYTYSWTIIGGTITSSSSGLELDSITVDWGASGTGYISVTAQKTGCRVTNPLTIAVDKYALIISKVVSGNWNDTASWDCSCVPGIGDNPKILNGHTITLDQDVTINHLIIESGGTIDMDATDRTMTIDGELTVDGNIITPVLNSELDIELSGVGSEIGGKGTLDLENGTGVGTFLISGGNKTIASTAVLTFINADIDIFSPGISVTNNGSMIIDSNLIARNGTNTWINSTNSFLKVEGTLLSSGVLIASAAGNTVYYCDSTGTQNVKDPRGSQYYNLTIGGDGTKTMQAIIDIDGNLTITDDGVLDITAANNYSLTIGGNWINSSIAVDAFLQQNGTVTFDGTDQQNISGAETFYDLIFNNSLAGDAIFLESPLRITNSLTLTDGQIVSDAINIIDLSAGATLSYVAGSFVVGPLIQRLTTTVQTQLDYPVGKNNAMHLVELTITHDAVTETAYTVEYFASAPSAHAKPVDINNVSALSYWNIQKGAGAGVTDATVNLYYLAYDDVSVEADLRVVKDDGAGNWVNLGGSGTSSPAGSILSNSFTTFSEFSLASGSGSNPLPVTLVDFTADINEDGEVIITWLTATEVNNDYFILEKSADGISFKDFKQIIGYGNSSSSTYYEVIDPNPYYEFTYYRLKQIDFDGTINLYNVISVEYSEFIEPSFIIYPNPVRDNVVTMRLAGVPDGEKLQIDLFDISGNIIFSKSVVSGSSMTDDYELFFNQRLKRGIYYIRLIHDNMHFKSTKIIAE